MYSADENNVSFEPMDVDTSGSFSKVCNKFIEQDTETKPKIKLERRNNLENNYSVVDDDKFATNMRKYNINKSNLRKETSNNYSGQVATNVRKYHINKENIRKKSSSTSYINLIIFLSVPFIVFIQFYVNIKCSGPSHFNNIKENLIDKLYGQTAAIESIIEALDNDSLLKLVAFHGGTGVGKSYASQLITDHLKNCSNVYHYTLSSFKDKFPPNLLHGCNSSLIVVDDLKEEDSDFYLKLKDTYEMSKLLKKQLTVILIFNCDRVLNNFKKDCDTSIVETVQLNVNVIAASKFYIKFQPLTEIELEKCVQDAVSYLEAGEIETQKLQELLEMFDVSSDGCKDVYGKIKSIFI